MSFPAAGSLLFSPYSIRGLSLGNRIVLPAMVTRLSGEDGFVNADGRDRYLRFARGEPGLMVLEAMGVTETKSGPLLRASHERFVPGLRDLVRDLHASSPTRVAAQIIHFLKISRSGWRQRIQDLDRGEIDAVIGAYGEAAARVRDAGFDAVELHMAHAYTLSSFLSRRNDRRDEFGGASVENRLRVPSLALAIGIPTITVTLMFGAPWPWTANGLLWPCTRTPVVAVARTRSCAATARTYGYQRPGCHPNVMDTPPHAR